MDIPEFDDPASPIFKHPLLQEARQLFRAFYSTATANDQNWFDTLVLAHVALTQGTNIPREAIEDRDGLERAVDGAERNFMTARDRVRACPSFRRLMAGDQRRIAAALFEVFPPTE